MLLYPEKKAEIHDLSYILMGIKKLNDHGAKRLSTLFTDVCIWVKYPDEEKVEEEKR